MDKILLKTIVEELDAGANERNIRKYFRGYGYTYPYESVDTSEEALIREQVCEAIGVLAKAPKPNFSH